MVVISRNRSNPREPSAHGIRIIVGEVLRLNSEKEFWFNCIVIMNGRGSLYACARQLQHDEVTVVDAGRG